MMSNDFSIHALQTEAAFVAYRALLTDFIVRPRGSSLDEWRQTHVEDVRRTLSDALAVYEKLVTTQAPTEEQDTSSRLATYRSTHREDYWPDPDEYGPFPENLANTAIRDLRKTLWFLGLCDASHDGSECEASELYRQFGHVNITELIFFVDQSTRHSPAETTLRDAINTLTVALEQMRGRGHSVAISAALSLLRQSQIPFDEGCSAGIGELIALHLRSQSPLFTTTEQYHTAKWTSDLCPTRRDLQDALDVLWLFAEWNRVADQLDEIIESLTIELPIFLISKLISRLNRWSMKRRLIRIGHELQALDTAIQNADRPAWWDDHSYRRIAEMTKFVQRFATAIKSGRPSDFRSLLAIIEFGGRHRYWAVWTCFVNCREHANDDQLHEEVVAAVRADAARMIPDIADAIVAMNAPFKPDTNQWRAWA